MRAMLVNIMLVPVLFLAAPLAIVLSLSPGAGRMQEFRRRLVDWLDKITNDYGAELIYLEGPVGADTGTTPSKAPSPVTRRYAAAQTKLIIVPSRRRAMRDTTT